MLTDLTDQQRIIKSDAPARIAAYLENRIEQWEHSHPKPKTNGAHASQQAKETESEPTPAPMSLQDRIAALRSKGMSTTSDNSMATPPSPLSRPPALKRVPSAPTVAEQVSPKTRIASDHVEDAAENRSGSVPPSIEASMKSLQLDSNDDGDRQRRTAGEADFDAAHFPSLEQLEQQFSTAQPVPSVNQKDTNGHIPRPPLLIPPKPAELKKGPKLPFTNEVLPRALWEYLQAMFAGSSSGSGSRALLLDVRPRHEFESARIIGESVCLEPVILRKGVTSADIESSLSVSPKRELEMFEARHTYDVVIVYDRSSQSAPNFAPPSTAPEAQRILWNLTNAIYEHEFTKSLQRQPVLLKGGWQAWEREIGSKGIIGSDAKAIEARERDVRKENRRTAIMPDQSGTPVLRTSTSVLLITYQWMKAKLTARGHRQHRQNRLTCRPWRLSNHHTRTRRLRASQCQCPHCKDPDRVSRSTIRRGRPILNNLC